MTEPRLKLTLAYCGTPWRGWQSQAEGGTVQDEIEAAIRRLIKRPLRIQGASRTDAGVHALGQVAHLDTPPGVTLPLAAWKDGLNALLPQSIRVLAAEAAPPGYDACGSTLAKTYRYRVWRAREMDPFQADRAWHVHGPLDLALLRAAAARLIGTHNFVRLSANRGDQPESERRRDIAGSTRTLHRAEIRDLGEVLEIELEGDGFLYRMARMITGSLIHLARGRDSLAWFTSLLETPDGLQSHQTAPAGGLYLVRVTQDAARTASPTQAA
jgi:tRNA pseudouridine38-40 synthase